ncbi:hypothetical protein DICPUDRAFT_93024 [Dictyostelium purpureum]|uniref:Uncharacterized protein n=1 Tax=Dictyostelium purpureum TaxID=5786 RepID=F1A0V1_DICPU|nr:uncharacterized protein DICPUDRAFT_93024 [Dictyostelium purpureum]EGC30169.1 hypothetical protein DICPUDRAFT_93024 [Dictyostelium purpureum]|eukprot:XP_003293295.1 hypothetical protein DICPUDRAFT_93024 [Dictyostelium purpureum]
MKFINFYSYKIKYLIFVFLVLFVNYGYSFEVYLLKYDNLYCGDLPLNIIAASNCSNFGFIQVAIDNRIAITKVNNTTKDCTKEKEINEFVELHHCYLNKDGTSYKYILNEKTSPTLLDDFCNEVDIIDCKNNYIKSFKNNTCIRENFDGVFQRYDCSNKKDIINVYRCTGNCNDTSCILKESYPSNVSKCVELQPSYNPFPQTHHSTYNETMGAINGNKAINDPETQTSTEHNNSTISPYTYNRNRNDSSKNFSILKFYFSLIISFSLLFILI